MKVKIVKRTFLSSSLELETDFYVIFFGEKEEEEVMNDYFLNTNYFNTLEEAERHVEKVKKALELAKLAEYITVKELEF